MKHFIHTSESRGRNRISWLDSFHSFSFGHYFDPERIHFGALRVLNDDTVAPGGGFGTHPHDNMEIVSIPLQGVLEHADSTGNSGLIQKGDVQIMSAGTGIRHSEYNHSNSEAVKFLQIWVFPSQRSLQPGYHQKAFDLAGRDGKWQTIVDPDGASGVKINQNAWFSQAILKSGEPLKYELNGSGQGAYVFVTEGEVAIAGQTLKRRDAMGIWETESFEILAADGAEVLVIEVPMDIES